MEILMNIKCSTNPNGTGIRPTLKVVDHHHQLQQQHNSLKAQHSSVNHHKHMYGNPSITITSKEMSLSPCMEYTGQTLPMDCCSAGPPPNTKNMPDLQWAHANQKRSNLCNGLGTSSVPDCPPFCEYAPCCTGMEIPACCAYNNTAPTPNFLFETYSTMGTLLNSNETTNTPYDYQEPEENFVSIEDEKIKAFLLKVGEEQKLKEKRKQVAQPPPATVREETTKSKSPKTQAQKPVVFEIIELDDVDEREKLQRIRESAEKRAKENQSQSPQEFRSSIVKSSFDKEKRKSPNISLIRRTAENESIQQQNEVPLKPKEKIIAKIDLLDSDSSDSENESSNINDGKQFSVDDDSVDVDNEDSTSSRLIAAAAVTCELGCDDEIDQGSNEHNIKNETQYSSAASAASAADEQINILHSEDEENIEFIEEQEEGLEVRWDDLEDHNSNSNSNSRGERQLFECPVCGKKVQSNYNLRRHMMIHTGERPFGCDLCERRFREISDLKKHRRRHATEKNFVCMICRVNPPLETDSTRCNSCDTKNGTLIAAVRPDTVKTPPEIEQMFGTSLRSERRKLNTTSNSNSASSTEPPPSNLPPLMPIVSKPSVETPKTQLENAIKAVVNASYPPTLRLLSRKAFPCPMCTRSFGTRHNLKRHFMIHTGEKPFSCPSCRKPFREYSTLKKHLATHRRDRWYKCSRCPQKYRDYLDYMDHKSIHGSDGSSDDGSTPTKRSKYRNDEQEDSYFTNDEDDDVEDDDTSTIEDCLECCECGQRFNDIDQFTEHIKEHDSNRIMYECYRCKQLFEEHKDLVDHMNSHHQVEED